MNKIKTIFFRQVGDESMKELPLIGTAYMTESQVMNNIFNTFKGHDIVEWICPIDDGCLHYKEMTKEQLLEEYGGVLSADQVNEILNN